MKIAGWQKVSLNDYPEKITTMIFTAGCNFQCKYCHNEELVLEKKFPPLIDEKTFFDFLKQRKGKIDAVTISGGEPTVQSDLLKFMAKVKKMGFLLKLDSNGVMPQIIEKALSEKLLDYIAMDIKAPLDKYEKIVGWSVPKEKLQKSIDLIMNSVIDYEFRTTAVPSLLSLDELLEIAKTIKGAKRYFIQNFRPEKTLFHSFKNEKPYKITELEKICLKIRKYIEFCEVR